MFRGNYGPGFSHVPKRGRGHGSSEGHTHASRLLRSLSRLLHVNLSLEYCFFFSKHSIPLFAASSCNYSYDFYLKNRSV